MTTGPRGSGRTHRAVAVALATAKAGYQVLFIVGDVRQTEYILSMARKILGVDEHRDYLYRMEIGVGEGALRVVTIDREPLRFTGWSRVKVVFDHDVPRDDERYHRWVGVAKSQRWL